MLRSQTFKVFKNLEGLNTRQHYYHLKKVYYVATISILIALLNYPMFITFDSLKSNL